MSPNVVKKGTQSESYSNIGKSKFSQGNSSVLSINYEDLEKVMEVLEKSLKELKKGHFLWHDDLHVNNIIWHHDKLILLDIDSFCISKHVPICYLHNHLFGQMEEYNRKNIMDEGALFGNEY